MASIKGISEDFPGAYSGQGRSWELKTKEAIELLPDKHGFQPKVVLSARAPPTITATAVDVPMHERAQYGSAYIAVSDGAGQITPRKLAGRPEVFGYQPRRHSYIADHPLKMVPGAEIGKKSIFDLPPWGPP